MCDVQDVANVATNIATLGLAGVGNDGLEAGVAVEGLKTVTGAKAAEEANDLARTQMEEEKKDRLKAREDAKAMNAAEQIRASRSAGTNRKISNAKSGTLGQSISLGDDERDFLGL